MFDQLLEKIKEYKLFAGLALVGLACGAFFLVKGSAKTSQPVDALTQEVTQVSSSALVQQTGEDQQEPEASKVQETGDESGQLTVDIKGAVRRPGVYQLQPGARVFEAIEKAGGLTDEAEIKSINQAQKLTDEAVIYVAKQGEEGADVTQTVPESPSGQAGGSQSGQTAKVNLNTATEAELQTISGIGQKRAQDILAYRETNGKFKSVDDLQNVSGIGAKTLEKLKEYVTVD